MKNFGKYLLADNLRAAIAALACALLAFILPTGFIAVVVAGLVTLQKGYKSGLMVLAFVLLPVIAFLVTHHMDFFYRFGLLLIQCGLIFIFALILRHTGSWQWVVKSAAMLGILAVGTVHIIFPDIKQTWAQLITHYLKTNDWTSTFRLGAERSAEFVHHLAPIATGGFAFFVLFGMIVLLILARWWQASLSSPGRLQMEFTAIRINPVVAGLLLIASLGLIWQPAWLIDMYPVLLLPFMLAGLSILHRLVMNRKDMILLVLAVYVALLLLTFFTVIILAIIGLIDSFYNFRKRYPLLQS
ncbi:hypothetical protein AYM02_07510 [Coxiella burnetii]|uniref:hypothetical protein n=1 Tax=Coxiella burnetii TaxID=777 RepID=UPI00039F5E24|nr:hypothetical protein [Coxiella burnetii]AML49169.1 hypothetical protein AUR58_08255 [Coxiella burnetii]AML55104.1 hypothetical protein AYM38_07410 [Coxiella burnetii]ATN69083.1 hypothetical protein AYM00_07815 [Coxiella burnetii]ATN71000.1 hypothetical protein AYM02_07510 [Coxiella burnetii]ATN72914.1 hypothetical protein AYM11_07290 [Coxiella burnetii]